MEHVFGCVGRRASSAGKDLASGGLALGGLVGKGGGGSGDAQQSDEDEGPGSSSSSSLLSSSIAEGEPPEPAAPAPAPAAPPKPAAAGPPKPAKKQPPKPAKKAAAAAPPKPKAAVAAAVVEEAEAEAEAEPARPSKPQMALQVEPSDDGVSSAQEIQVDKEHGDVDSVLKAVGAALGVAVTEVSMWDDDFEEYAVLEDASELADGKKVQVVVG